jgi:protein gp37
MISVDGAQKSGSGTSVCFAMALAALLNDELHRDQYPGKTGKAGVWSDIRFGHKG